MIINEFSIISKNTWDKLLDMTVSTKYNTSNAKQQSDKSTMCYKITPTNYQIENCETGDSIIVTREELENTRTLLRCFPEDTTRNRRLASIKYIKTVFKFDFRTAKILVDAVLEDPSE